MSKVHRSEPVPGLEDMGFTLEEGTLSLRSVSRQDP